MVRLSQGTFPRKSPEEHNPPLADFGHFFRSTYDVTVRWAVALGLGRPDAEDALQDAYASIYQHWRTKYGFRQEVELVRLLRHTVKHKVIDASRRAQSRRRLIAEVTRVEGVPYQRDGRKYEELVSRASGILAGLPTISLSVFQRYFVENQSEKDIADSLGLSPEAVRAEIGRVRRALKEGLAAQSPTASRARPSSTAGPSSTARSEEADR